MTTSHDPAAADPDLWIPPIPAWDYADAVADCAAEAGPEEAAALPRTTWT